MTDRYLFRGKPHPLREAKSSEWIVGWYDENMYGEPRILDVESGEKFHVDPATVCQCTGLRDKNDMLIFEGDIVQFAIFNYEGTDSQCEGVIKWSNAMWEIWKSVDFEYYGNDGAFALGHIDAPDAEIKVIGNIYNDPELLQGSERP